MTSRPPWLGRRRLAPGSDPAIEPGSIENPIPRRAARVLVIDDAGRVLMFRGFDPADPGRRYWFTAGGGLDPGESPAEGAVRELWEETGLRLTAAEIGPPVWQDVTDFPYDGRWYRQEQEFFAVRVGPEARVHTAGFDAEELRSIDGYRWWSVDELAAADEPIYPPDLPDLLRRVYAMAGSAAPDAAPRPGHGERGE